MNADAEGMHDLGGTLDRDASDRKLDRFAEAFDNHGHGRWVIEGTIDGGDPRFLVYAESWRIEAIIHSENMTTSVGACAAMLADTALRQKQHGLVWIATPAAGFGAATI